VTRWSWASQSEFLQESVHLERDDPHVMPTNARTRVKIYAQLIRTIQVISANWMRMQFYATEINDPCQPCCIIDYYFISLASRRK
jgi:hypothetical protein